jgi:hypothetical protein
MKKVKKKKSTNGHRPSRGSSGASSGAAGVAITLRLRLTHDDLAQLDALKSDLQSKSPTGVEVTRIEALRHAINASHP